MDVGVVEQGWIITHKSEGESRFYTFKAMFVGCNLIRAFQSEVRSTISLRQNRGVCSQCGRL